MAYSALSKFGTLAVYVEQTPVVGADGWRRYDGGGEEIDWTETPGLKLVGFNRTSGAPPSEAILEVLGQTDAGPLHGTGPMIAGSGLDSTGSPAGSIVRPEQAWMTDQVKIVHTPYGEESGTIVFRGLVTGVIPAWRTESGAVHLVVSDQRWLMQGAPIVGWRHYNPALEESSFLAAFLPVFNPNGKGNRCTVSGYETEIITPGWGASSAFWARGHVWNGLREHFLEPEADPEDVINYLSHAIDWPELASDGDWAPLFDADNVWPDMAIGGIYCDKALDLLVHKRGGHDWWLAPDGGNDLPVLTLYGTAPGTIAASQTRVSFARGTAGQTVQQAEADVIGGGPSWDASRVALQVLGLGARKRYDLSFDTVAGSAGHGWLSEELTAWLGLSDAERRKQYKNVLRRFVVPLAMDWVSEFGWTANVLGEKLAGAQLVSTDPGSSGSDGQPVRLRAQVWRSKDSGSTWEELPQTYGGISPIAGGLGIELAEAARDKFWTWDGDEGDPVVYDLRLTISVECEERLAVDPVKLEGTDWPRRDRLLLDDHFKYEARRKAYMNQVGGSPVLNGGTPDVLGPAADQVVRNDGDRMSLAMVNLADQLARLGREGDIVLSGFRPELKPGDVLEEITGGDVTEPFGCVIRKVKFEFGDEPKTTVWLEAD